MLANEARLKAVMRTKRQLRTDRRTSSAALTRCAPGAEPSLYYHTDNPDATRKSTQKRPGRGTFLCFPAFLNP